MSRARLEHLPPTHALRSLTLAAGEEGEGICDFPQLLQRRGLMVLPRRGDALILYNQLPGSAALDERTRHGSCPVRSGTKAILNVWFWNREVVYR